MRTMLAVACWGLMILTADTTTTGNYKELKTGVEFPTTMQVDKTTLVCTGADVRTKWMVKVYAIAHYGDPDASPIGNTGAPEEYLPGWIEAPVAKAFVLKFTYGINATKMQEACNEAFDRANYHGKAREPFLASLKGELKKGDEFRLLAQPDGTLTADHNRQTLGSWKDPELIKALWTVWLGDKSPLSDRKRMVAWFRPAVRSVSPSFNK